MRESVGSKSYRATVAFQSRSRHRFNETTIQFARAADKMWKKEGQTFLLFCAAELWSKL